MAAPLASSQYAVPHSGHYRHSRMPQPPPSPPMEDSRCSLPSISKLLGLADVGSPTSEASPTSQSDSSRFEAAASSSQHGRQDSLYDGRPASSYAKPSSQRGMPPTPPMGADSAFDSYNSPSIKAVNQFPSITASGRYYETTPPLDNDFRRQQAAASRTARPALQVSCPAPPRQSYSASPFPQQAQLGSGYYTSTLQSAASCHPQISNLYYQQTLPQSFPPLSVPVVLAPSSGASPWQHHHYLTPSHGVPYPQSQDRYICQTCNKAFSRPSSLRIHSHSHTGEKPFKCPHTGCGKAFSVRSNMKRHEKGCHSFEVGTTRPPNAA
ncbi:hypothetical protein JDV02_000465 [Purpureocillium takamizusanense]|uniref:C2H2-type domain-containing protein n=1 Tax=Purpureocillium takamizusanense TaxID=2060973 RepID=A0A9Q8Q681_9HYPO|nr:uncharacterized protein JDV02_000465 [Purpureocillium takamizusanense]UNI13750.1 hypothetical protein JDV02_000465 [Purpureocillium takamizusanense]